MVNIPKINSICAEKHIRFNYANLVDMFPPTDSAKSGDDVFPTTDNVKDINPPRSLHVECVVLMSRVGK